MSRSDVASKIRDDRSRLAVATRVPSGLLNAIPYTGPSWFQPNAMDLSVFAWPESVVR
jgi:hypothetical protein